MQKFFILIFSLLVSTCKAQFADGFSDGNFSSDPQWHGDTADFIVNSSQMLQLNATTAGNSTLSVPVGLSFSDTLEWNFKVNLDFAPSSANYCRIYLAADTTDSGNAVNGYFLQFGESLSNDAIELFRHTGTVITSVCRGPDAQIASAFYLQVKVIRYPTGSWEIFTDENLSGNFVQIASGSDTGTPDPGYFFIDCNYTSGNLQRFYFDDFYAGKFIPDNVKPVCRNFETTSDSSLQLVFSEKIRYSSATALANYNIIGLGNPVQLTIDSANDYTITLNFNQQFDVGIEQHLQIQNLEDEHGNTLNDTTISFFFFPVSAGKQNDIVFSEIYFEMSTISPLPNAEFVELFNRSDSAINLSGWWISDGSSDAFFPDLLLQPKEYLVVFDEANEQLFSAIPDRIGLPDFPGLNNDSGDTLTLYNPHNEAMEKIAFNDDSYHDNNKNDGGWTIERIDADFTCQDESNWTASLSSFHGTPGLPNSVAGIHTDNTAPYISNLFLSDSVHLKIELSEPVFSTIIPSVFTAIDKSNVVNDCISIVPFSGREYVLEFSEPFDAGIYRLIVKDSVRDCAFNTMDLSLAYRFGKTEKAEVGDVVINELLFDPPEGGEDFVELYNCSSRIIDLNKWIIQEAEHDDANAVKDETLLSSDHRIIFPGEYLTFTRSVKATAENYFCPDPRALIQLEDLPDYNSDEGRVILRDETGAKFDDFPYSEKMHFYLLNSPDGVSLERLNGYSGGLENVQWHSAASTVGFATPGYKNSHTVSENSAHGEIKLTNEVFSPDNNGYEDLLAINYNFEEPGTVLSLSVYSKEGIPVRELLVNQTVSESGQIFWDGFSDIGKLVSPGRYLICGKSFHLQKGSNTFRTSCVVAVSR